MRAMPILGESSLADGLKSSGSAHATGANLVGVLPLQRLGAFIAREKFSQQRIVARVSESPAPARLGTESYRVHRRALSERGWSPWDDPVSIPRKYVSVLSGWS